ncbi:hypothetical protein QR680_017570 [Steinernema hermaphroditum]|uniref:fumarate reductase (NADH) n=1 Tax=Steinernema hermaphroditum TaxID=289476 RepID=A0AA39HH45_9BILA|nr:hypothetical protein QR680_017570 [Steinernema hermaphroditum]
MHGGFAPVGILALLCVHTAALVSSKMPKTEEPVIVVGGGLAGLSAAVEALRAGAKVILVEREKDVGGNSAKASSGINGCGTEAQHAAGIKDSTDKFYSDTMSAGDRENDGALVDLLVHESADAVQFLIDLGVDLSDINICGGHSVPRTHWIPSPKEGRPTPVGIAIIRALKAKILKETEERPEFMKVLYNTEVLGLVTWNEYITGVRIKRDDGTLDEVRGKAVILTTGGFSADRHNVSSLLAEFAPEKMKFPTTNGPFARGDGVKMARAMGAQVIGMEHVQVHPTAFLDPKDPSAGTKFLAAEALRGKGALLVSSKGVRFANELGRRDYLSAKIQAEGTELPENKEWKFVYMLMTDEMADSFGRPAFNFYANIKGFFTKFENANTLAEHIGCDSSALRETFDSYNGFVKDAKNSEKRVRDSFDKTIFPAEISVDASIYAAKITPALHYTMGGLKIDKSAVVFNEFSQKPFNGLLAAGEVTGGVHGRNRLAGNSLLECVIFGRIAGKVSSRLNFPLDKLEL